MMQHKASHWQNRPCPRILGIDEHRFTRRQGFLTTFCDLAKRRVFDVLKGRSAAEMTDFLRSLKGRNKVKVVCMDMNSAYCKLVREWFPNARLVTDRFHVIRLVNQHFSELCKSLDEKRLAFGRGRLMRLMLKRPERLKAEQQERLRCYLESNPAVKSLYIFMHNLNELLRNKTMNKDSCRFCAAELLEKLTSSGKLSSHHYASSGKRCTTGGKKWPECSATRAIMASRRASIAR